MKKQAKDLVDIFMEYHEDPENWRNNRIGFDRMYEILMEYGDEDEYVDEVFKRAPVEKQREMIDLIQPHDLRED